MPSYQYPPNKHVIHNIHSPQEVIEEKSGQFKTIADKTIRVIKGVGGFLFRDHGSIFP